MNRGFYPRLAWTGMKQNRRLYLPYLLTCTGITAMFYILMGLSVSSVLPQMSGGRSTALIMSLGSVVIAVFALIFLFYTHSFLIRRRSREFGLYNVLGMGKGNIARILLWETLLTYAGTTVTGLALGVALSKLAELGLMNLLRSRITYTFTVNAVSLLITLALFAAVHTLIFLHALWQLYRVSAVALLHSESVGEKPPRARWALAVLGLVLLGGAYWLAVSIRDPLEALLWFFAAVIMVILGTYLLFITGSVALCRALQRNPRYYYQSRHFVSVSSMAYRMKRNGAGLASVCVLATMVLVMLSSTTCMYYGVEDALHQRYVRDINVECYFGGDVSRMSDENLNALRTALTGAAEEKGSSFDNEQTYRAAYVYGILTPEGVLRPALAETDGVMESTRVTLLPLSDYNAVMGTDLTLAADEALVYGNRMTFKAEKFTVGGTAWRVRGQLDSCPVNGAAAADVTPSLFVVVPDFDSAANTMLDTMSGGAMDVQLRWYCSFDSDLPAEEQFGGGLRGERPRSAKPDGRGAVGAVRRRRRRRYCHRLGGGLAGRQPQRFLRQLRRAVLPGHHAQRGVPAGRRVHHLLQADLRGLRGSEPLRHHAEGGHDETGHPPQHQLPAADGVLPAHGPGRRTPVLRVPLHPQAPAAVQPQQHTAAHRYHRRQLCGLRPAVHAGVQADVQRLLPHRQRRGGA